MDRQKSASFAKFMKVYNEQKDIQKIQTSTREYKTAGLSVITVEPDEISNPDENDFSQYKNESPFGLESKKLKDLLKRDDEV